MDQRDQSSGIPEAKRFGTGDRRYVQAQRVWLILVAHVMAECRYQQHSRGRRRPDNVLITYGELAERMGMDSKAGVTLGVTLGIVGEYCRLNDLPTLNSIVINQQTGVPGDHVLVRKGKTYQKEQREVARTDWFAYRVPTTGAFRKVREHLQRQS